MIILNKIKNKDYKCSITVEATLSFTLMIFILFISLGPLLMCKTSSDIINDLDTLTKEYAYLKAIEAEGALKDTDRLINNNEYKGEIDIELDKRNESITNLLNTGVGGYILKRNNGDINNPFCNIDGIAPCNIIEPENYNETIIYDYEISFKEPLNIINLKNINQRFLSYRRPYIGSEGGRQLKKVASESETNFYTANDYKNTKVYHIYKNCYYLEKTVYEKIYVEVKDKYRPCSFCADKIANYDNYKIYITNTGDTFHIKEKCPSMTAIVTKRDKTFIDDNDLRLCSGCQKRLDNGDN